MRRQDTKTKDAMDFRDIRTQTTKDTMRRQATTGNKQRRTP